MEIERPRQQKAFLGGYRHRLTGVEFHHATSQTPRKSCPEKALEVFSRDTQVQDGASTHKYPTETSESDRISYRLNINKENSKKL